LWDYRTSIQIPTRKTLFFLVYGVEAMLPLEIEISSMRIALQYNIIDEVACQKRLDQLLLLYERRVNALEHMHTYQSCIK